MTNCQIFGFPGGPSEECEYLTLAFSPLSVPLRSRWRNNGLSADFLGDYVTTFLPSSGDAAGSHQTEIRHAVAYIANELLENAMKYHQHDVNIPIGIHLELANDHIMVSASNGVGAGQAQHYKEFVERMTREDPGDLLAKQLESGAAGGESAKSCMGLLTMVSDYGARLGWRFESHATASDVMTVTTSAVLPLKSVSGVSE